MCMKFESLVAAGKGWLLIVVEVFTLVVVIVDTERLAKINIV